MDLFRVSIRVRPKPHHPQYWDVQFGYLQVWLFGDSPDSAGFAGLDVAKALPYELVGEKIKIHATDHPPLQEEFRIKEDEAKNNGLSWLLIACATGVEEGDFEEHWENESKDES